MNPTVHKSLNRRRFCENLMGADNQQGRTNYRLEYFAVFRDDSLKLHRDFYASNDDEAKNRASEILCELQCKEDADVESGKTSWVDKAYYKSSGIEKLEYVVKEVEQTTSI